MFHDEHVYPEPFKFNPDRFENQETNKLTGINELPHIAFGFARRCVIQQLCPYNLTLFPRLCPGQWLAQDSIWIAIVSVLSVYNISAAIDDKGFPIVPSVEYTEGQIRYNTALLKACTRLMFGRQPSQPFQVSNHSQVRGCCCSHQTNSGCAGLNHFFRFSDPTVIYFNMRVAC